MHCQTLISFLSLTSFAALVIQVKSLEYVSLTLNFRIKVIEQLYLPGGLLLLFDFSSEVSLGGVECIFLGDFCHFLGGDFLPKRLLGKVLKIFIFLKGESK